MIDTLDSYNNFDKLFNLFETHKGSLYIKKHKTRNNRHGFPQHRGAIYGISKERFTGIVGLSYMSKKYPEIFEEIRNIGNIICPFDYTSIQVNRNLVCTPHIDTHNVGRSVLVSFGKYKGCNIVIDGKEYNAYHQPIMFNGAELEHYNTPLEDGIKYSLVFYKMSL